LSEMLYELTEFYSQLKRQIVSNGFGSYISNMF